MGKLKKVLLLVVALCMMISIMSIAATATGTNEVEDVFANDIKPSQGTITVSTAEELRNAVLSEGAVISLSEDIDLTSGGVLKIGKSVTILGNEHTIKTSNNDKRVIRITASDLTVRIYDCKIISDVFINNNGGNDIRGISVDDVCNNTKLLLDNCNVSAEDYAINVVPGPHNLRVTIKGGTVAAGWAAINSYSNDSTFVIKDSVLRGTNKKNFGPSNNFNTINIDGYGLIGNGEKGNGNTVLVQNTTVYSDSTTGNKQRWLGITYGAKNNTIIVDSASKLINSNNEDQTFNYTFYYTNSGKQQTSGNNVYVDGALFAADGNGTKVTVPNALTKEGYVFNSWKSTTDLKSYQAGEEVTLQIGNKIELVPDFVPAVAQIDDNYYASLAEALAAVKTAASSERTTITLLADTNEVPVIDFTYPVQINGQGHKLGLGGASAGYAMRITAVGADVIIDNTVVGSMSVGRGINVNASGVKLVVQNNSEVYGSSYPINVYANQSGITVDNNHITITNSTIKGYCALNLWGANGVVDVTGSTLWGENNASYSPNNNEFGAIALEGLSNTPGATGYTVNVTNTTIKVTSTNGNEQYPVVFNPNSSNNTVYLTSCTIDRENATLNPLVHDEGISGNKTYVKGTTDSTTSATPVLPSGYNYCEAADGYKLVGTAVAKIGEATYYASLADAIAAAQSGDTITLLSDVTLTGTQKIEKSLTIDGNGKTVNALEGSAANTIYYVFFATDEKVGTPITVTLENMTMNTAGYQVAIMTNGDYNSAVNVNNVDITTDGAAIYANGHVTVQATGCDIVRTGKYANGKDAVYYSALNVGYGGGIVISDSNITVNGGNGVGTFPSGGSVTLTNVDITVGADNVSGLDAGYALWSRNEDYTNYPDYCMDSVINVTSGTINGDLFITDKYLEGDAKNKYEAKISVTGGTFDHNPTAYVAEGYKAVDNGNSTWTVVPADVYTAAASAATGNLSVGGAGNTFRFTITKNGTKLTTTAEYSAEKDNWELVYDHEYIELTKTAASGSGIGYTVKALKAGETTITFRNKADPTITASTVLTNKHAVSITYNRGTDASGNKYLLEKGALTITKITFDGVAYTGEDLNTFLASHTLTADGNATINGLNVTPNATGNVYIHVTDNEDATVTARSGLLNFINAVAQIGNDDYYATLAKAFGAAQNGDTITLISDITEFVNFGGTAPRATEFALTLDLNGHTFTAPANENFALRVQYGVITIKDSVGTGAIRHGKNSAILVDHLAGDYPSKVIIESGTFTGKSTVVQTGYPGGSGANYKYYGGELEVLGGTFVTDPDTDETYDANGNFKYTLNMLDMNESAYAGGIYSRSSITVKGGTFENFDPANNLAEGENTNFVAEGYESVELTTGTWTVRKVVQNVAEVNGVGYPTLAEALAAAQSGDTIKLLTNVTLTERLFINAGSTPAYAGSGRYATTTENKSITLDLNENNITSSSNIALAGGSLNITGAGTITTTASGLAPVEIRGTGDLTSKRTLTIGANVVLNGDEYGLNVFGSNDGNKNVIDVTVNGRVNGTLFVLGNLTNAGNEINIVVNGTIAAPANTNDAIVGIALNGNANVTVNTGAEISGESGIEVRRGTLTVKGGTITATATEYSSTANNSGSTTKGAAIAIYQYGTGLNATINGGTLSGVKTIAVNGDMSGVSASALQTYTTNNTVIPAGYKWAAAGENMYTLTVITYVAQIGDVKYETLQAAIDAATDGNTITLLRDIDLTATVNIEKSLTIDLNNKSITATNARALWVKSGEVAITGEGTISATKIGDGSFSSSSSVIRVGNSGTAKAKLTIGTGVTVSTDYCYGVTVFGTNDGGVELVVNGNVTVTGTAAAISGNGNSGNKGNVTINAGAVVTATADAAIYHPQGDALTINGGSITGPVAVYQKSGTMTISGGTFTANAQAADYTPKGDGLAPTGDTIVIDNCGYPGGAPSASISGATITITNGKQIGYYVNGTSAEGTVLADSAYTLNTNTEKKWVADTSVTGYSYRIATPTYVAQIGETKYTSLADAIAAANADTTSDSITITLLKDIDFSTEEYAGYKWAGSTYNPLTITRSNVTIDLDGHTISEMGNTALVFGNILAKDGRIANITIKNGTLRAGKTADVTNSYVLGIAGVDGVLVQNITTLGGINVYTGSKNVVIENCNVAGTKYYTVCAQCGSDVTIKGTTFTKNTDSTVANKSMFWIQGAGTDSDMITDKNPTGAFDTSSITIESGNFTVDTSNGGVFYLSSGVKPIVKGGYFNINPTAYVADGYAAVTSDLAGYTHKVVPYVEQSTTTAEATTTTTDEHSGTTTTTTTTTNLATAENGQDTQYVIKIETTVTTTPEQGEGTSNTETVYQPVQTSVNTANKTEGAEETGSTVSAGNENAAAAAAAAVKNAVENATAATFTAALTANDEIKTAAKVLQTTAAANAIAKAAATVNSNETANIAKAKIELQTTLKSYTLKDGVTAETVKATKVVYDIKPVAVLYKVVNEKETAIGQPVELDNADIKEGESFTFTIPVPANMATETPIVKVSHIGTNGYSTEIGTYEVQGTGDNRYVTVTVDHFSEFELEEAAVSITGSCDISAAISLSDSIDINFYVKNLADGTSLSDYKVVYSFNGGESKTYIGNEWTYDGNGKYKFTVASCAARQMNDTVTFEVLYNPNGSGNDEDYVSIKKVESYSIRQYCLNKINANSDQKLVDICRAVLDYGAEAQKYFGYKTNELANRENYGLTSKETIVSDTYKIAVASKADDITKLSASLNTVSKTEINFYVTTASNTFSAQVTLNGNPVSNVVISDGSDGVYKITVKGIAARNLDNVYVLTVETAAGPTTLTYSALAYTYRKQDSSLSESGLSLAIYNYYLKAKAYFG